jgi:hypothetical protein
MRQRTRQKQWGKRASNVLATGLAVVGLSACDSLLEVDLPHLLTDDAIAGIGTAELQVNSAIALFECGYTGFGAGAVGHDDTMTGVAGVGGGDNVFTSSTSSGGCDGSDTSVAWFDQIMGARGMLSTAPSRMVPTSQGTVGPGFPYGRGVYDRIQDEWGVANVLNGERLSAISAIYVAMALAHIGEFECEAAIDGSDLLTPDQVLAVAEDWITTRALTHTAAAGTSLTLMPFGITTSATANTGGTATEMALAIRARIKWARGDLAGADADAANVLGTRSRFTAWVTRDVGATRRNKIWFRGTFGSYSGMTPLNRVWNDGTRANNPATNAQWPAIIPFTGWIHLGITSDGRTLEPGNIPVRFANEARATGDVVVPCNGSSPQPGCVIGAVQDTRVTHGPKNIQTQRVEMPFRYGTFSAGSDGVDVPYMTWEELRLIRAERYNQLGDRANAIAQINAIRGAPSIVGGSSSNSAGPALPLIQGAYLATLLAGTQADMRAVILEERRREFFTESGRYWSTKIQNTDMLWFPRNQGGGLVYNYQGGVRIRFDASEYTINPYFVALGRESAQGTGCDELTAPGYTFPNAQKPVF